MCLRSNTCSAFIGILSLNSQHTCALLISYVCCMCTMVLRSQRTRKCMPVWNPCFCLSSSLPLGKFFSLTLCAVFSPIPDSRFHALCHGICLRVPRSAACRAFVLPPFDCFCASPSLSLLADAYSQQLLSTHPSVVINTNAGWTAFVISSSSTGSSRAPSVASIQVARASISSPPVELLLSDGPSRRRHF